MPDAMISISSSDHTIGLSIWDEVISKYDTNKIKIMNKNTLVNEINQLYDNFKKTEYLKGIIAGYIGHIDFLRVNQLMNELVGFNHDQLIDICSDGKVLIQFIRQAQNCVHKHTKEVCRGKKNEDQKAQKEQKDNNNSSQPVQQSQSQPPQISQQQIGSLPQQQDEPPSQNQSQLSQQQLQPSQQQSQSPPSQSQSSQSSQSSSQPQSQPPNISQHDVPQNFNKNLQMIKNIQEGKKRQKRYL